MAVEVTEDFDGAERALRLAAVDGINAGAITLQGLVKRMLNLRIGPSRPGQPPGKVTGALERSIVVVPAKPAKRKPTALVGTNSKYAAIHEYGGTINGRMTIPLTEQSRKTRRRTTSLRSVEGLHVRKGASGKVVLTDGMNEAYLLTDRVNMPPRPYFKPAIKAGRQRIADAISRTTERSFERRYKGV